MTLQLALAYLLFAATLLKALLVRAKVVAPSCARCGLAMERRYMGERICDCRSVR